MSSVVAADTWPNMAEKSFHIHTVFQRQRCRRMTQIMEAHMLASCVLQNELQPAPYYAGVMGQSSFTGDRNIQRESTVSYTPAVPPPRRAAGRSADRFFVLGVLIWSWPRTS